MEIYKRLELFERDPKGSLRKRQLCTPAFARGLLAACDVATVDDPRRGEFLARIARQLADQLADPHLIARSYGALGTPFRAQGRLDEADDTYAKGLALAADCTCSDPGYDLLEGDLRCLPDLVRRQAHLRIDQSFAGVSTLLEAERVAQNAVLLSKTDETQGQSMVACGLISIYCDNIDVALETFDAALKRLPLGGRWKWLRDVRWIHYEAARQNVILALSHSNNPDDIRLGLRLLPEIRDSWSGLRNISPSRAILDWNEGSLTVKAVRFGLIPVDQARRTKTAAIEQLGSAKERLISEIDIAAISADIAAAFWPDRIRIRETLESTPVPEALHSDLEQVLKATTSADLAMSLWNFRQAATAVGAPPPLFPYPQASA